MAHGMKIPMQPRATAGRDESAVDRGPVVGRHDPSTELRLMTIQEAADYARVSVQTIRRWLKSGKLRFYRAGRQIRIDMSDLVAFFSQQ